MKKAPTQWYRCPVCGAKLLVIRGTQRLRNCLADVSTAKKKV